MDRQRTYNIRRALWFAKGMIPSLIGLFLPRHRKRIIFNSTRNEYYNFNSRYLFEYFVRNYPEYEIRYVMNDPEKRQQLNQQFGSGKHYFIETESLKGMWYALQASVWVTSAFETPVGGLFLRFRRFVYLLGHGTHFKAIVFNERRLPKSKWIYYQMMRLNFSAYLVTSRALLETYRRAYRCRTEQLAIMGEPRHDRIFAPDLSVMHRHFGEAVSQERNVLYAPTWRPDGAVRLFPFEDTDWDALAVFLEQNRINIFLRLHPSFQEDITEYTRRSSRIKILDNTTVEEISEVMGFFNLLITDYSSIFISFLLLDRPVMFLPYDLEQYDEKMGFIRPYDELTPGPKPDTFAGFLADLSRLLDDRTYYRREREEMRRFFNDFSRENCKMNAEYLLERIS